ncbi:trichohyalin-like [Ambystoma mexicanum]|uniref:trichohyalin-like n=1 Tax=Ambystoma mexicanum TaxID=8296 RepID=UPI0037E7127F
MSALTIALAPYCKLYEAIKEGIQDNTSILASVSTKVTNIENYMTALEEKNNAYHKDWEKEVEELKKQIKLLQRERGQEDPHNTRYQSESQKGETVDICEEEREASEINEPCPECQQQYPIKSGLLKHPQKKVPVVLKPANNDKRQKQALGEKVKQQDTPKEKENKEKNTKGIQEDLMRSTNREKKRCSPRSVEDFMSDINLMNLSQHWENASNNSVIEVIPDQQETEQNTVVKRNENPKSPKTQTSKRTRKASECQRRPALEEQTRRKDGVQKSPREQRERRQSQTHRSEAYKGSDDHQKTGTPKIEKQRRIFKVEQLDLKKGYMILNRRMIVKLMSTMNSLKKIKTEDITLVQPYHKGKIAKAYIHVQETCLQDMDKNVAREMEQNGFELTEIKTEKQREKNHFPYHHQGERKSRYTSRKKERYRGNRIGKNLEEKVYSRERADVRTENQKDNQKWTNEEKNKENRQRRNEHQETDPDKYRSRTRGETRYTI